MALSIVLASCAPDPYPPPPQYEQSRGPAPPVLELGFPNPHAKILADVVQDPGIKGWQWTYAHPRFSFQLDRTDNLDFYLHFGLHDKAFVATGPVTLTIRINGDVIDRPQFDSPGLREYTHPVPERVLRLQNPVHVAIDVDPPWLTEDKEMLGIVLVAIGFAEHGS